MSATVTPQPKRFVAVDLFCGAGGSSSGVIEALTEMGMDYDLLCINHWDRAIESHKANHPTAKHLCTSIDNIDPRKLIPGGRVNLLWGSPECTHFSIARGGRPMKDQSRASAFHILRWAEALYIDSIVIENVKEFQLWGPLGVNGRPIKANQGETFQAFLQALRSLSYSVSYKVLCCADYGDPTSRERLFILARRGNKKIAWPEPSHSKDGGQTLFDHRRRWRGAREIIDWSLKGESIFTRKRPLAESTMRRIQAGIVKFAPTPEVAKAFLVVLRQHMGARSLDEPVPTVTASGTHLGLCEPFLVPLRKGQTPRGMDEPLPTLTTNDQMALCAPFVLQQQSGGVARSVKDPLPTVATKGAISLIEPVVLEAPEEAPAPFLIHTNHPHHSPKSVDEPMGTVTAQSSNVGVVEPFLVKYYGTGTTQPVDRPMAAVTTKDRFGLCEPFLVEYHGDKERVGDSAGRVKSVEVTLPTQTTANRFGLVEPILLPPDHPDRMAAGGNDSATQEASRDHAAPESFIIPLNRPKDTVYAVSDPVRTVTATSSDFGLVEPFITPIDQQGSGPGVVRSIDEPTPTITSKARLAVVEPFIVPYFSEREGQDPRFHSVEDPLPTVTSHGAGALVEPFILPQFGGSTPRSVERPLGTLTTTSRGVGLVEPYIVPVNHGKGDTRTHSLDNPMPTVTSVDAWDLVEPQVAGAPPVDTAKGKTGYVIDVRFRMLQPTELAAAMSFSKNYKFLGNREEIVKMIGNAVPKETAKALAKAVIAPRDLTRAQTPDPHPTIKIADPEAAAAAEVINLPETSRQPALVKRRGGSTRKQKAA